MCSRYAKEGRIIGERAVEMSMVGREAEAGLLGRGMLFDVVGIWSRAMFVNVVGGKE